MARYRGCVGTVYLSTGEVAQVRNFSFGVAGTKIEPTEIGGCSSDATGAIADIKTTGTIELNWDQDDTEHAAFVVGGTVDVELYPFGHTTGLPYFYGTVLVDSASYTVDPGDFVTASIAISKNGTLTEGDVA